MWTYTAYILGKYCEKNPEKYNELPFIEFAKFVFDVLWRKNNLIFHDGIKDLFEDFKYLQKLGIVELHEEDEKIEKAKVKIKDKEKLAQILRVVEDSGNLTGVKLFDVYARRINSAIETISVAPSS